MLPWWCLLVNRLWSSCRCASLVGQRSPWHPWGSPFDRLSYLRHCLVRPVSGWWRPLQKPLRHLSLLGKLERSTGRLWLKLERRWLWLLQEVPPAMSVCLPMLADCQESLFASSTVDQAAAAGEEEKCEGAGSCWRKAVSNMTVALVVFAIFVFRRP